MSPRRRRKIAKIIALVISFVGILVLLGWIANIQILKSILPIWISMKFSTAIGFFLSGILFYSIARSLESDQTGSEQVLISIVTLTLVSLMGVLFLSFLFGINSGIEDLFVKEINISTNTVIPGKPSFLTMLNFVLISLIGIFTLLNSKKLSLKLKIIGPIIAIIGALAVTGYILNIPLMYYFLPGINSAMAAHTAILFVLSGIGLICLSKQE